MKLLAIAAAIGARVVLLGGHERTEIRRYAAADRMSDLLAQAGSDAILVTHLSNTQLGRIAALMDAPAICLLDGRAPSPELLWTAREHGIAILICPEGLEETCRRLQGCFGVPEGGDAR